MIADLPSRNITRFQVDKEQFSGHQLLTKINEGTIVIPPCNTMGIVRNSQVIESILLGLGMGRIFFHQAMKDGKVYEDVIDGKKRIKAFHDFMGNKFSLQGLKLLDNLNGMSFNELGRPLRRQLEECTLDLWLFRACTPPDFVEDFIARI